MDTIEIYNACGFRNDGCGVSVMIGHTSKNTVA